MKCALMLASSLLLAVALASPILPVTSIARGTQGGDYTRFAVAADTPLASQAGAQILSEGGNAADAAAATMLALGVVSPAGSGLGGGGFALYYSAKDGKLTYLDFRERAPAATTPEIFQARKGDTPDDTKNRSRTGGLAAGVPGEAAGIEMLVKRFGSLPMSKVVAPAEKLAREGFTLNEHTLKMVGYKRKSLGADPVFKAWPAVLTPDVKVTNIALADTLARIGSLGAKGFYEGPVARAIVAAVKRAGGNMTAKDLRDYSVREREPVVADALGLRWVSAPAPSAGGYTMLESLSLLDAWMPTAAHWKGAARYHALAESFKGPYLDRQRYFGDPDHVDVPIAAMQSAERRAERRARYRPQLARPADAYDVPIPGHETRPAVTPDNAGTSHLCVVDEEGNVAAVTTTVNLGFGAGFSAAGLWLNDEMDDFAREVGKDNAFGLVGGAPNLPAPGKRPVSSMSPTIVLNQDGPVLCVGGSGGSRIITAVEQVALRILREDMHPQVAIEAPRIHHQGSPNVLSAKGLSDEVVAGLEARGHVVKPMGFSASVQAISISKQAPRLRAGSDPTKGGQPAGE